MKRFYCSVLILFSLMIPHSYAASFTADLGARNDQGAQAITVSLSEISQEATDRVPEDSDLAESILEMRLHSVKPVGAPDSIAPTSPAQAFAQPTAPKLFRKFSALDATGFEPADPNIAVGPVLVVAVVNRSIAIFTKLGQKVFQTTLRSFFSKLPDADTISIFYPKVMYDSYNKHFLVVMEAIRQEDKKSWYFLAVSKTDNPLGAWAFWELNMSLNGAAKTVLFGDYPGLGLDQQAVYLTGNMSNWSFRFQYAKIRVLKKSELYKFGKVSWHDFFNMVDVTGAKAISIQPAQGVGPTTSEFLVSNNPVSGTQLTLWNITNPTQPGIALTKKAVPVTAYALPPDASQKGGPLKINAGDSSLGNAVLRNGVLYTAHTVSRTFGTSTVAAIRFYEINADGTVAQEVTYGSSGSNFYFPSTMVDSRGNVVIVFNRSSGGQFVGIYFTGRKPAGPHNTLEPNVALQPGLSYYHLSTRLVQLWGAYNGVALDYDDSIWMIGAFSKRSDLWNTSIGKVSY